MGMHVPPTFRDGTVPIDAIFATAGIKCINAYILPHKGGLGDHWSFILNFTSTSYIGTKLPTLSAALQGSYTANPNGWSKHIMQS
jgi:hypothetical protein